ncbi:MAG: type II toxin-antitoxin system RelE/ParE family toxin [Bacteroidales bacterium]|nr:type II toxin-antitoxin system RelE/ParE family toxin [Bacteroidales bacterium]
MAEIKIAVKAQISLKDFMLYSEEEFGQKALKKLQEKVWQKIADLEKFPEIGFPEPLLSNREECFRACIVQKPIKMVYHYDKDADTDYIDNFWDMRRNPASLKKNI